VDATSKDTWAGEIEMPDHSFDAPSRRSRRQFLHRSLSSGSILAAAVLTERFARSPRKAQAQESGDETPLLIDADWLEQRRVTGEAGLVLLDLGDLSDYQDGHLPGAVHSYWLETVERDYPFYGTVLNQKDVASDEDNQGKRVAWMRRHGIGPDDHVVAYDHGAGRRAARIVWFLHFLGHQRASLLDGGVVAWRDRGYALETGDVSAKSLKDDPIVTPQDGYYLSTGELELALADPGTQLIDVRTDEERRDTVGGQFPTGVIPGSRRLPWTDALSDDGRHLLEPDALRAWAETAGLDLLRPIILYGQFGCDTNLPWLALRRGMSPGVMIYDRGWVEWVSSGLPVEPLA
jgi:thiosulfate/3-mercaptopyruvate sulfurtransferase